MPDPSEGSPDSKERFHEAWEHTRAARNSLGKSLAGFIPPGFTEHRRAAHREMLLALRSLIDTAIERGEKRSTD
ncbi:MAG: hypothetical protein M0Z80_04905 [Treponema sp.]|nr:hypothetical protein [Treponema sp.]